LELGVIVRTAADSPSLLAPFALALAYQLGNLVPVPVPVGRSGFAAMVGAVVALVGIISAEMPVWGLCLTVALVSALINSARQALGKTAISTTLKRGFRIVGFLLCGFALVDAVLSAVLVGAALIAGAILWQHDKPPRPAGHAVRVTGAGTMAAALVLHQMHYFSYCTLVLVVLVQGVGPAWAAPLFVAGWVSYVSVPHLVGDRLPAGPLVIGAHLALAGVLMALALVPPTSPIWVLLWVATGLFGGTVVYLTGLAEARFGFTARSLAAHENLGHMLGAALALLWVASGLQAQGLQVAAAIFALTTAVLTWRAMACGIGTEREVLP
jgi:hypothetical protein